MKRGLWLAVGVCGVMVALGQSHASPAEDAKKVCLERYNVEKEGGTLPVGMNKTKYLNQCTLSILRTAKQEAELKAAGQNSQQVQNAGENELTPKPGEAPKQTTARTTPH